MHPVDENPLLRNSMELAAAYSQLVSGRWQFVAGYFGLVMGPLVAIVSLFPSRDWPYLWLEADLVVVALLVEQVN